VRYWPIVIIFHGGCPNQEFIFLFFFSHISHVPISISSSADSSHWSFYVYMCYENGPHIGRERRSTFVGIGWLHPGSRVAREPRGQRRNRVDYETRSVHFGHRLRSRAAGNFATCKLNEVWVCYNPWTRSWCRPMLLVVRPRYIRWKFSFVSTYIINILLA